MEVSKLTDEQLDEAFQAVLADQEFQLGWRSNDGGRKPLERESKEFFVKLYIEMTGKTPKVTGFKPLPVGWL